MHGLGACNVMHTSALSASERVLPSTSVLAFTNAMLSHLRIQTNASSFKKKQKQTHRQIVVKIVRPTAADEHRRVAFVICFTYWCNHANAGDSEQRSIPIRSGCTAKAKQCCLTKALKLQTSLRRSTRPVPARHSAIATGSRTPR